jgi:hypothetical protein
METIIPVILLDEFGESSHYFVSLKIVENIKIKEIPQELLLERLKLDLERQDVFYYKYQDFSIDGKEVWSLLFKNDPINIPFENVVTFFF